MPLQYYNNENCLHNYLPGSLTRNEIYREQRFCHKWYNKRATQTRGQIKI